MPFLKSCIIALLMCLSGWLEQDSSCPTCRLMLPSSFNDDAISNAPRGPVTHFFYFDGPRIAQWLPSFSVEFTHGGFPRHFARNERAEMVRLFQDSAERFPTFVQKELTWFLFREKAKVSDRDDSSERRLKRALALFTSEAF
uniref:Uncharacterized protein n=1 Tax=Parascaris equorum TaxID=6256 RepID=A0A914RCU3_PAREQ